ncbi:MAG: alpha/beta hydrolase [Candidatus Moraniibacteriota bacterium]
MCRKLTLTILLLGFACIFFSSFFIKQSKAVETQSIASDEQWDSDQKIEKNLTIEAGVTVLVKKGTAVTFDGGSLKILGKMIVSGTLENPVTFKKGATASFFSILIPADGNLIMRNVDFSGGGLETAYWDPRVDNMMRTINGGLDLSGGSLDAQNCDFHDNFLAINIAPESAGKALVNRSSFLSNSAGDVSFSYANDDDSVDFKYNWWGSSRGPSQSCDGDYCYYPKVSAKVDFSSWRDEEAFIDPVIVIPGTLGSWKWTDSGEWKLDPIFKTYDDLVNNLKKNGYEEGVNLFLFPYQWRDSNINNAKRLRDKISEIKQQANWPKVDLVAHSMGGLLAREYIESDYYQNDVNQLITLGTPHNGSPEDYLIWDGGTPGLTLGDKFLELIFKQEAKEAGYENISSYLHKMPIASVRELLPTYDYLFDIKSNKMRSYVKNEYYPKNTFLEKLNLTENKNKLQNIEFVNIIGKTKNSDTINKIKVGQPSIDENSIWAHGYPENFDLPIGDHGLGYGSGDGTVPLESSNNIISDEEITIDSTHTDLPTKAIDNILESLLGYSPKDLTYIQGPVNNIFLIMPLSPVDIQIISPSGKRMGKDFETGKILNEIEGAYYTGYDTENEFVTIPNPEPGQYKIITQGTGSGAYEIKAINLKENADGTASEQVASYKGTASLGAVETHSAQVSDGKVSDPNAGNYDNDSNAVSSSVSSTVSSNDGDNNGDNSNKRHSTSRKQIISDSKVLTGLSSQVSQAGLLPIDKSSVSYPNDDNKEKPKSNIDENKQEDKKQQAKADFSKTINKKNLLLLGVLVILVVGVGRFLL